MYSAHFDTGGGFSGGRGGTITVGTVIAALAPPSPPHSPLVVIEEFEVDLVGDDANEPSRLVTVLLPLLDLYDTLSVLNLSTALRIPVGIVTLGPLHFAPRWVSLLVHNKFQHLCENVHGVYLHGSPKL